MRKEVGKVTISERDTIKRLHERKNGLEELAKIILNESNPSLYDKLVCDLGETTLKIQRWWDETSTKYNWESVENGRWEIDFDNCTIILIN